MAVEFEQVGARGWLAAALLSWLGQAGVVLAQTPPPRAVEAPIEFVAGSDDNLFSVLRSQDHIHEFEEGRREVAAGEHRAGVDRLAKLLLVENGGVVPVAAGRFLGLRLAVVTFLANMPPLAADAYAELARNESGGLTSLEGQTPEQLARLADRFPASPLGQAARVRLGDVALTAGNGQQAMGHFRIALDGSAIGSSEERRLFARLCAAATLVDPTTARADVAAGRGTPVDDDVLAVVPAGPGESGYPSYGGGASGRTPMAPLAGRPDTRWKQEILAPGFGRREIGNFAMFAVGDLDGLFLNTGHELVAIDPLRADVAWTSRSAMREQPEPRWRRDDDDGGVNQDMVLAAACSPEIVVGALQVPEKSVNVDFQGSLRVMSKIPQRRLFAFGKYSGKELWAHFDELDGPRTRLFRGHDVCANPLIAGDTVYVPIHDRSGAIAFSVAAYDLQTGRPKWRRLVCSSQQDVNMFGNARTEFAASPLCLANGVLYGASNLGVAYAIEAATGRLRWISSYEVVRMPRAMMHNQQERQVFFANNAPVVVDGVLCTTPLDSQFVLGLEAENGRPLWRLPAEATVDGIDNRVLWLAGALGNEFVLTGAGAIAVRARPTRALGSQIEARQLVRPDLLFDRRSGFLPPRPAVTADAVWFARNETLLGFDRNGKPVGNTGALRVDGMLPGNLLLVSGILVAVRQMSLHVAFDSAALLARVETEARARPDDPGVWLRLAGLRLALLGPAADSAARAAVQDLYRVGLGAAIRSGMPPLHPVRLALQRELFEQAKALADASLQRGGSDALTLLLAARDVAPDTTRWIQMQALVLARCQGDRTRFLTELDALLTNAGDGTFPLGDGVPVRTWVAWQRARQASDPKTAVRLWQELLEQHGPTPIGAGTAAHLAETAIAQQIQEHGPGCYAEVQARAEAALAEAKDDRAALTAMAKRFPNSTAARSAQNRILDLAVGEGDLASVCTVLASTLPLGKVPPGIARRVLVAASRRGNFGLARNMLERLRAQRDGTSDWPEDRGAAWSDVATRVALPAPDLPQPLLLPARDLTTIAPRSASEFVTPVPVLVADGFAAVRDAPLYVRAGRELLAIDVHAPGEPKPILFQLPLAFLEHTILCGRTLVVPDMERVFAVDYRTGTIAWEMPNEKARLFDSLGVQSGVLHVWSLPNTAEGTCELIGLEPLTGALMFRQATDSGSLKPKANHGGLLRMTLGRDGGATIERLDPLTGHAVTATTIAGSVLKSHVQLDPDNLATRLFPQGLCQGRDRFFLPIDSALSGGPPSVVAVEASGAIAWHWRGTAGSELMMPLVHGETVVVGEGSERRATRILFLRASDGTVERELTVGHEAALLNWDRSWLDVPTPPILAIESFADAERSQRQLVCCALDGERSTFVLALGREDGEIASAPQFGPDFLTFVTRPAKGGRTARLHAVSLANRAGMFDGQKHRLLAMPGNCDGMSRTGSFTVISGAQGILLLGQTPDSK